MQILVNGHSREVPEDIALQELIGLLDLAGKRIAVELNEELVPRSRFAQQPIRPGDRIEVIHAVGGG